MAAAYIHDIGKMGQFHLTALNVSEYDGHKIAAQKACTPRRRGCVEGVKHGDRERSRPSSHMYERFDGKGFPERHVGQGHPARRAPARRSSDTYADLTQNPRNPFRKALSPADACAVLVKYRETIFDPHLVDSLQVTWSWARTCARGCSPIGTTALIIDVDPEETTVLELRMIEARASS